jgi:hypothetical protein
MTDNDSKNLSMQEQDDDRRWSNEMHAEDLLERLSYLDMLEDADVLL